MPVQPAVLLYTDALDHLVYATYGGAQDREQYDIRQAVQNAYREVSQVNDWTYFYTHGRVTTAAPHTNTVGSYTSPTITLGTALSAAQQAAITLFRAKIGTAVYPIVSSSGVSSVTLDSTYAPASLTADTAITFFRSEYQLPVDFRAADYPMGEGVANYADYISPQDWLRQERIGQSSGNATRWTIMADLDRPGCYVMVFDPYPSSATTVDFTYIRTARPIILRGDETNSISGTIGSAATTVTCTTATFTGSSLASPSQNPEMVGAFIRYGDATNTPTGLAGKFPYYGQRKIRTVTSTTVLETTTAFDTAAPSLSKYLISDPIDLPPIAHGAFLRCCELELNRSRNKDVDKATGAYIQALREAFARDWVVRQQMVARPDFGNWYSKDMVDMTF